MEDRPRWLTALRVGLRRRLRRYRTGILVGGAIVGFAVFALLLWRGPAWLDSTGLRGLTPIQRQTAVDADRGRMTQLGAGLLVAGALVYTARNFRLSWEGHVTDRYTKAIEQLGSDRLDVRLGAIYGLERIMIDSERDHPTIVEVLAAFVREHSRVLTTRANETEEDERFRFPDSETDVRAAVRVLGRRPEGRTERGRVDLTGAYLVGAFLMNTRLSGAILKEAYLAKTNLSGADLSGADLSLAYMTSAVLTDAVMIDADLAGADLNQARMICADLTGANLNCATALAAELVGAKMAETIMSSADLTGADLAGADLTGADLTNANLNGAAVTEANMTNALLLGVKLPGGTWQNPTIPDRFRPPQAE